MNQLEDIIGVFCGGNLTAIKPGTFKFLSASDCALMSHLDNTSEEFELVEFSTPIDRRVVMIRDRIDGYVFKPEN